MNKIITESQHMKSIKYLTVSAMLMVLLSSSIANATAMHRKIQYGGSADPYMNHITSRTTYKAYGFGSYEIYEGVNFYADTGGTRPIYSGYKRSAGINAPLFHYDYMSSTSASELTGVYETNYLRSGGNGSAVRRWYNPSIVDHINTTWENLSGQGYFYEGILGYE